MKFAPFIYEWLVDAYWLCPFGDPNEFFGFEVPFTKEEFENSKYGDELTEEMKRIIYSYVDEHGIDIISTTQDDRDLKKGCIYITLVFSFDGDYYAFDYINSYFHDPFVYGYPEARQVFPHNKEVIKYY